MDVTDFLAGDDALIFQGNLCPHLFRYGKNAGAGGIRVDVSDVEVAIWTDQARRDKVSGGGYIAGDRDMLPDEPGMTGHGGSAFPGGNFSSKS